MPSPRRLLAEPGLSLPDRSARQCWTSGYYCTAIGGGFGDYGGSGGEVTITGGTVTATGGDGAEGIGGGYVIRAKLEMARGIWTLVGSFEAEYAKRVRNAGRLVFADVPRLITGLGDDARLALEYRMDAKIRAWALDEFQDTSREQWAALSGLIEEAKQSDGEKSVFVVGDRKQAIYGWRNGDVGIFTRERTSGAYEVGASGIEFCHFLDGIV